MHPLPTAGTSLERTFRSISFTSSSEWVMISGMGLSWLYPDERSSVTTSISKEKSASPFLPSLFPLSPLYSVYPVSLYYSSSACLTVLLLSITISHRTIFQAQSTESPLPWQQCHIIMYLLGWEDMCWFVVAVRLDCMSHSPLQHRSKDMSNVYLCQRLLNEQAQTSILVIIAHD